MVLAFILFITDFFLFDRIMSNEYPPQKKRKKCNMHGVTSKRHHLSYSHHNTHIQCYAKVTDKKTFALVWQNIGRWHEPCSLQLPTLVTPYKYS